MISQTSESASIEQLVRAAKTGEDEARDQLIRRQWNVIGRMASRIASRPISLDDDLWSVALMAFNEAIDAYKEDAPAAFNTFAKTVIRRRLIDQFRRRRRRREFPLSSFEVDEGNGAFTSVFFEEARRRARMAEYGQELTREMVAYREVLREYSVELDELVDRPPRHRAARERARQVADLLVQDPESRHWFIETKRLPLKRLTKMPGCPVSRSTIERHRPYIVAVAVVRLGDFTAIQSWTEN